MSSTLRSATATTIGDLFQRTVDVYGAREALVFSGTRWTYRRLSGVVDAACDFLERTTGPSLDRVAIVGRNHPAFVVSYLAAQALGASTVEISAEESLPAILNALALAQPAVVLTDRDDLVHALQGQVPVQSFDSFITLCGAAEPRRGSRANRPSSKGHAGEASVVFTSGTTGVPKGVVLSQGNLLHVNAAVCEYLRLTSEDRYGIILPLCHTYGKSNLLSAFTVGATAVLLESFQNPRAVFESIQRERCTVFSVVPFHLNVITRRGKVFHAAFDSLRAVTTAGGPLSPTAARAFPDVFRNAQLHSMYGLTESATRVSQLDPAHLADRPGSVGRPLPGVEVAIHDEQGAALPPNAPGEIVVRGPNIMQGYLGDAKLTARTVVDGWLLTGDIGTVDEDGFIWIRGRKKELIKVAGERISPVEIEQVLLSHPQVADAAVTGLPDDLLGESVAAHVVARDGMEIPGLGSYCAAHLSHHKIPRRFLFVDAIPRTATGKVKRYLLQQQ